MGSSSRWTTDGELAVRLSQKHSTSVRSNLSELPWANLSISQPPSKSTASPRLAISKWMTCSRWSSSETLLPHFPGTLTRTAYRIHLLSAPLLIRALQESLDMVVLAAAKPSATVARPTIDAIIQCCTDTFRIGFMPFCSETSVFYTGIPYRMN